MWLYLHAGKRRWNFKAEDGTFWNWTEAFGLGVGDEENKTIRFPIPLIERIENAIRNQDVTFSSFVLQACEYALNNMENKKSDE